MDLYLHLVEVTRPSDAAFSIKIRPGWSDTQNPSLTDPEYVRATVHKWATPGPEPVRRSDSIGRVITGDLVVYAELHAGGPSSTAGQRTVEILKPATHLKRGGRD